jgi:hypothetical protein
MDTNKLTKQSLLAEGYMVAKVEHWNHFAHIRQDLWGFDFLAIGHGRIIGVQTTTKHNLAARIKKLFLLPSTMVWLESGGKIILHGWYKVKNRCQKRVVELTIESINKGLQELLYVCKNSNIE